LGNGWVLLQIERKTEEKVFKLKEERGHVQRMTLGLGFLGKTGQTRKKMNARQR